MLAPHRVQAPSPCILPGAGGAGGNASTSTSDDSPFEQYRKVPRAAPTPGMLRAGISASTAGLGKVPVWRKGKENSSSATSVAMSASIGASTVPLLHPRPPTAKQSNLRNQCIVDSGRAGIRTGGAAFELERFRYTARAQE